MKRRNSALSRRTDIGEPFEGIKSVSLTLDRKKELSSVPFQGNMENKKAIISAFQNLCSLKKTTSLIP